eukprot:CAMPEP_0113603948 /NCGR_PEP_ID=MMETSP0017_2-20120614/1541_1 /TAXON_ID=2856 /ORGANISM="Cylindrotheca closterium" /LENGTH=260 /DNA_ID=CAMNT_0000512355 /DNA_START=36 /DNA_END=814 /DNA_ORIENTATION=+ /assembly_acc=CAM_ASM_000147
MAEAGKGSKEPSPDTSEERGERAFHLFSELHEDIANHILLFIADAPLEQSTEHGNKNALSSLTHIVPLISKTLRDTASTDFFWKESLLRQLNRDDSRRYHWQAGLQRLLPKETELSIEPDKLDAVLQETKEKCYKDLYRKIMTTHIQGQYPIFIMPCQLRLGEPYGLHLFEPRYRIMVRDLLESSGNYNAATEQAGADLTSEENGRKPPLLIHACLGGRLGPGEYACLVQLVHCTLYDYGTADVMLLPVSWVRMDKLWVR